MLEIQYDILRATSKKSENDEYVWHFNIFGMTETSDMVGGYSVSGW